MNNLKHAGVLFATLITLTLSGVSPVAAEPAAAAPVKLKMSAGPSVLVQLTTALGNFQREGLEVEIVDYHTFVPEDCQIYLPLNDGRLDASLHWLQHVFMGAGEGKPIEGIMVFNDAPGMSVLVANRLQAEIKTAADFKNRNVSEGVPMSTKSFLTNYLTVKAGLPAHSYKSVLQEPEGRVDSTIKGLQAGEVDLVACMEPMTSQYLKTKLVSRLFDLSTHEASTRVLGGSLPAQSLLIAPSYAKAHPEVTQKLVNAFVRTMRFVNSHSAAEIADALPADYLATTNRAAAVKRIENWMPTFARNNFAFARADVALARDAVFADTFLSDEEGRLRADTKKANPPLEQYYDNGFVEKAMAAIP
jgi:NitT/TauT family transport system substrate-binding protein